MGLLGNFSVVMVAALIYSFYSPFIKFLDPKEFSISHPIILDGPMAVNTRLDNVERLHENDIHWPESLDVYNGKIYSGLGDGRIVALSNGKVETVCQIGSKCQGQHEENLCGRPLGIQFDKKGQLYVADAYHGLFTVNVANGEKKQLLSSTIQAKSQKLTFLNGLTLDEEDQVVYLTQSSTKWNLSDVIVSIFEHESSGRLLKYDIREKTLTVLLEDLDFPNGVLLSHDKKSVLVVEAGKGVIFKYHIKGSQKGTRQDLPLVIPGEADNLSYSKRGNYWVPVGNARSAGSPAFHDRLSHYPLLRKFLLVFYRVVVDPIAFGLRLADKHECASEMQSMRGIADFMKPHSAAIEFNDKGVIVQSLHSPSGSAGHVSEILEHENHIYLGSWRNRYLGKVKIENK